MDYDSFLATDIHHRITSPTCEDLGIPRDLGSSGFGFQLERDLERHPVTGFRNFSVSGDLKLELANPNSPFSPFCQIPLPALYGQYDYNTEPAFIRKRNERERERVRCVNEGYARLREHLPLENKDKRISKVETLRCAIRYIKQLQNTLEKVNSLEAKSKTDKTSENQENLKTENIKKRPLQRSKSSNEKWEYMFHISASVSYWLS